MVWVRAFLFFEGCNQTFGVVVATSLMGWDFHPETPGNSQYNSYLRSFRYVLLGFGEFCLVGRSVL